VGVTAITVGVPGTTEGVTGGNVGGTTVPPPEQLILIPGHMQENRQGLQFGPDKSTLQSLFS
jgi:hypothetical protein